MTSKDLKQYFYERLCQCYIVSEARDLSRKYQDDFIQDRVDDLKMAHMKLSMVWELFLRVEKDLEHYETMLSKQGIYHRKTLIDEARHDLRDIRKRLKEYEIQVQQLWKCINSPIVLENELYFANTDVIRYFLAELAALRIRLEWRAPAYAMSRFGNAFSKKNLTATQHNYQRSGYCFLSELEDNFPRKWYPTKAMDLVTFMTSSGMSAYTMVEDYLVKNIVQSGDTIMTAPYIYFENMEQLRGFKHLKVVVASSYDEKALWNQMVRIKPKVLFVDLIANNREIAMIDVCALFRRLAKSNIQDLIIVCDNTQTPTFHPFACWEKYFGTRRRALGPELIVIESSNKYRQLGLDVCMAGMVTMSKTSAVNVQAMWDSRRHTGGVLSDYAAHVLPNPSYDLFMKRMVRIDRNCLVFAERFNCSFLLKGSVFACHPRLNNFKQKKVFNTYAVPTGLVTFQFSNQGKDHIRFLDEVIRATMREAKKYNVSLVHGLSFGFDISRLSVAARMAKDADPFLRLSSGTENILNMLLLAQLMKKVFVTLGIQ